MILVTGATGNVGGALVARLSSAGVPARALVRSPTRADDLRGFDVEVAVGTYEDDEALRAALDGVDRLFLVAPASERMVEHESAVVRAAKEVAPDVHVVKIAAAGVDDEAAASSVRFLQAHREVVRLLQDSGLATTVLAPGSYMQGLLRQAASVSEHGVLRHSVGDAALSLVDVRDVAAVAAHVLTSDGHAGATYTVTGPEALTWVQVADVLGRVLGRDVRAEDVPADRMRASMVEAGTPAWVADGLLELDELTRQGGAATVTDEVEKATGSPGRSLEQFVQEHRTAFGAGAG